MAVTLGADPAGLALVAGGLFVVDFAAEREFLTITSTGFFSTGSGRRFMRILGGLRSFDDIKVAHWTEGPVICQLSR